MSDNRKDNKKCIILKDQPYVSEQVSSVYEQYVLLRESQVPEEKQRFHAFLELPGLWEVRAEGGKGAVIDKGKRKAFIFYRNPTEYRIVEHVDWYRENGTTFRTDYYNEYGYVYSSLFWDECGCRISKSFYTTAREEVIHINYSNKTVLVFEHGMVKEVFASAEEFERFAATCWLEHKTDGKGKKNRYMESTQILILTSTENVYGIEQLTELLPEAHFHIAAHTLMSQKLMCLEQKKNVTLYPGVGEEKLWNLFKDCEFYLDISKGREIYDAVTTAALNNLLILGFKGLLHEEKYVTEECRFEQSEEENLAEKIRELGNNEEMMDMLLKKQLEKISMR